jgi:hypothetical protein
MFASLKENNRLSDLHVFATNNRSRITFECEILFFELWMLDTFLGKIMRCSKPSSNTQNMVQIFINLKKLNQQLTQPPITIKKKEIMYKTWPTDLSSIFFFIHPILWTDYGGSTFRKVIKIKLQLWFC